MVAALKAGYRHIDTARKYGTERAVGEAMRASGVPRDDIFLTTKVSHEISARRRFRDVGGRKPRGAADVDYVDLLLVHWPNPEIPLCRDHEGAGQGQAAGHGAPHRRGELQHRAARPGASSSAPSRWSACRPSIIPISTRPRCWRACRKHGLAFVAYCPLGRGRLFDDPVLNEIAQARGRTRRADRAALADAAERRRHPALVESGRIADNLNVFDFTLSDDEMTRIAALKRPDGRIANPKGRVPPWD